MSDKDMDRDSSTYIPGDQLRVKKESVGKHVVVNTFDATLSNGGIYIDFGFIDPLEARGLLMSRPDELISINARVAMSQETAIALVESLIKTMNITITKLGGDI